MEVGARVWVKDSSDIVWQSGFIEECVEGTLARVRLHDKDGTLVDITASRLIRTLVVLTYL
jgi:hypothetical protein